MLRNRRKNRRARCRSPAIAEIRRLVACANLHIRSAAAEIADANKRIEEATDLIDPMIEAQGSQLHFVDKLWEPEEVQPPSEWNADGVWHAHCVEARPARSGKDRGVRPAAIASSHCKTAM